MNLNLDDRLNPDTAEVFEKALGAGIDLVGGDWRICFTQEETDDVAECQQAQDVPFYPEWPPVPGRPVRLGSSRERGTFGPATAWKTNLHSELGRYPFAFGDGSPVEVIGDAIWWHKVMHAPGKRTYRYPLIVGRYYSHPSEQAEFRANAHGEHEKAAKLGTML